MLRRSGFKRAVYERAPRAPLGKIVRPCHAGASAALFNPQPKEGALQHEVYMGLVRNLACAHCGRVPTKLQPTQFCHADEGKGLAIKSDCRYGWPGCGPDFLRNRPGCHALIGTLALFTQEQRRTIEALYGLRTRIDIITRGLWPADLPRLPGE